MLQGLKTIGSGFSAQRPSDPKVSQAAEIVGQHRDGQALGFVAGAKEDIARVLREHGTELKPDEFQRLLEYLKAEDERATVRRRFWVQLVISLAVVGVTLAL